MKPPAPVRVRAVTLSTRGDEERRFSGTIVAEAEIALSFKVGGYVTSLRIRSDSSGGARPVQAGDRVRRGAVLARVREKDYEQSAAELRAALASARAAAWQARLDHERAAGLVASGTIPQSEYDSLKARLDAAIAAVDAAAARLANAELALADASLRAPTDALVLSRSVELGTLVSPGTVAFRLADMSRVKVLFAVPEAVAAHLAVGTRVIVTVEALRDHALSAAVSKVQPQSDSITRTFDVEATIVRDRAILLLGMVVSVAVPQGSLRPVEQIAVPLSALLLTPRREGHPEALQAFVVAEERGGAVARARTVDVSGLVGNEALIETGLASGDRVVVQGGTLLRDGQVVEIVP